MQPAPHLDRDSHRRPSASGHRSAAHSDEAPERRLAATPLRFAVDLLTVVDDAEGRTCNPLVSPASVTMAGCMAVLGGNANQRLTISRVLGHDALAPPMPRLASAVSFRRDADGPPVHVLSGANAVFATDNVSFSPGFRDAIPRMQAAMFGGYRDLTDAVGDINAFCHRNTQELIRHVVFRALVQSRRYPRFGQRAGHRRKVALRVLKKH